MTTSLPLTYSSAVVAPARSSYASDAIWLVLIWAVAMLLFGAGAGRREGAGTTDPVQLLATF